MTYCVHIGYPKAASSFLQSGLFSGAHPDIKPLKSKGKKLGDYQKLSGDYFNSSYPQTPRTLAPFDFIAKDEDLDPIHRLKLLIHCYAEFLVQ
mgnify:CR=1 FL=1